MYSSVIHPIFTQKQPIRRLLILAHKLGMNSSRFHPPTSWPIPVWNRFTNHHPLRCPGPKLLILIVLTFIRSTSETNNFFLVGLDWFDQSRWRIRPCARTGIDRNRSVIGRVEAIFFFYLLPGSDPDIQKTHCIAPKKCGRKAKVCLRKSFSSSLGLACGECAEAV